MLRQRDRCALALMVLQLCDFAFDLRLLWLVNGQTFIPVCCLVCGGWHRKWDACLYNQGKRHAIIGLDTELAAAHAYDKLARDVHGEEAAICNFAEDGVTRTFNTKLTKQCKYKQRLLLLLAKRKNDGVTKGDCLSKNSGKTETADSDCREVHGQAVAVGVAVAATGAAGAGAGAGGGGGGAGEGGSAVGTAAASGVNLTAVAGEGAGGSGGAKHPGTGTRSSVLIIESLLLFSALFSFYYHHYYVNCMLCTGRPGFLF
jgi:hypothetical protein